MVIGGPLMSQVGFLHVCSWEVTIMTMEIPPEESSRGVGEQDGEERKLSRGEILGDVPTCWVT